MFRYNFRPAEICLTKTPRTYEKRSLSEGGTKRFLNCVISGRVFGETVCTDPNGYQRTIHCCSIKKLGAEPSHKYRESSEILLNCMWQNGPSPKTKRWPDLCVCAMILSICCHARISSPKLDEIVEYILDRQYPDGGFTCNWQNGDKHSSLHTTLTVLEAFDDYEANGYSHRLAEIKEIITVADEFILKKIFSDLFISVRLSIRPCLCFLIRADGNTTY